MRQIFHVEYHDVRDAKAAMTDLHGRVTLGMHLSINKCDNLFDIAAPSLDTGTPTTPTRNHIISFPASCGKPTQTHASRIEGINGLRRASLGQSSPLRAVSPVHSNISHQQAANSDIPSADPNERRPSNTALFDAVRSSKNQVRPKLEVSTEPHPMNGHELRELATSPISPTAGRGSRAQPYSDSDHRRETEENFIKSDPPPDNQSLPYYSTQLSASSYPFVPAQHGMIDPRYHFPGASPPPPAPFSYNYAYSHDPLYNPYWPSTDSRRLYSNTAYPSSPSANDYYYSQYGNGAVHHLPVGFTSPAGLRGSVLSPPRSVQPEQSFASAAPYQSDALSSNAAPLNSMRYSEHSQSTPFQVHNDAGISSGRENTLPLISVENNGYHTHNISERNQLNISRIEEGLDTRTTVMVKNIPNKMSDKDLVVFINKVCPRRIDFLYLRMDFQNGEWCLSTRWTMT